MRSTRGPQSPEHYWVDPGRLMGGQWPGSHLDWFATHGVSVLVNLTPDAYRDDRFRIYQIPVPDWAAPTEPDVLRFCALLDRELASGSVVYVHCLAGCGRTGTMMACYLVYRDRLRPLDAISRIRGLRACSIETRAQADTVLGWAAHMEILHYRLPDTD